jgi:hypothetical protein
MALNDLERIRFEKATREFVEARRPPVHLRQQLDLAYRITGQSIEIFEVRPAYWDPTETLENKVAKATYVKRADEWRIYWLRADLKWHRYVPHPTANSIDEVLAVIGEDEHCCFFG